VDLVTNLTEAFLYFFPGFVGLKTFYVFGLRTRRTDIEWAVWSILLSVILYSTVGSWLSSLHVDLSSATGRLTLTAAGLAGGLGLAWIWNRRVVRSQRWRLVAEPWDLAYWRAMDQNLQAVIELQDGREAYGDIEWMGLSGEGASRSLSLVNVQMTDGQGHWQHLGSETELHVPEASIRLLRLVPFVPPIPEQQGSSPTAQGLGGAGSRGD
jgi:hypothetical protein